MKKDRTKVNKTDSRNSKKIFVVAIAVVLVLSLSLAIVLFNTNRIYYRKSLQAINKNEFSDARVFLEKTTSDDLSVLLDYVNLRIDINKKYPELLTEYDENLLSEWKTRISEISESGVSFSESIDKDIDVLSERITDITLISEKYLAVEQDITELMDVFTELNRLYTKDSLGNNTTFTVQEETLKIERWELLSQELQDFQNEIPKGDEVYLLGYLIKESKGECEDLRKAMKVVSAQGYKDTDSVRVSGSAQKSFPSITNNNGESVNVLRKNEYLDFLKKSIHRTLIENLAEYYTGY